MAATREIRLLVRDARTWRVTMAAGGLVVTVAGVAGGLAVGETSAVGGGVWTPVGWILSWIAAVLALSCWVVPGVAAGIAAAYVVSGWSAKGYKKREKPFVIRNTWRKVLGWWLWLLAALILLVGFSPTGTLLAVIAGATVTAATATSRARARTRTWLLNRLARPPTGQHRNSRDLGWRVDAAAWDRRRPVMLRVSYPSEVRTHEENARTNIEAAVDWALQQHGSYIVEWPPGGRTLVIREAPGDQLPNRLLDRRWPTEVPGVALGVTEPASASAFVRWPGDPYGDGSDWLPVLYWDPDGERDLLVAGVKGKGKTTLTRGIVVRSLAADAITAWWILDGKSSGDYAALEGRRGIRAVARDPASWDTALREVAEIMAGRYNQAYLYESGQGPRPEWPRVGLLIDELTNVRDELGQQQFDAYMRKLSRMARAARITLVAATQRPDVREALPGPARDQFDDRVVAGWMGRVGAEMMLGPHWRAVTGDADTEPDAWPRGRAVARIAGRIHKLHIPWLDTPTRDPGVEGLYPPRTTPLPDVDSQAIQSDPGQHDALEVSDTPVSSEPDLPKPAPPSTPDPAPPIPAEPQDPDVGKRHDTGVSAADRSDPTDRPTRRRTRRTD